MLKRDIKKIIAMETQIKKDSKSLTPFLPTYLNHNNNNKNNNGLHQKREASSTHHRALQISFKLPCDLESQNDCML